MQIQWKPELQLMTSCNHLGVTWEYGETKDIPEDQKIRVTINGETRYMTLSECLLGNPDFKLADTGKNPNFACSDCGNETRNEATYNPLTGDTVPFERDGERLCRDCFLKNDSVIAAEPAPSLAPAPEESTEAHPED